MEEMGWTGFFAEAEPIVERLTARYVSGYWREEARQVARIACWQNAHRYDPGRGAKLSTFLFVIIRRALADFYEREAACLTLHIRDGLPLREVAVRLGLPYETIKKQKQRCLARLRTRLLDAE